MKKIESYISKRIKAIQSKYNFNPGVGTKQFFEPSPVLSREFGSFQELIKINQLLDLNIAIPYDSLGLSPENNLIKIKSKPTFVYFIQVERSNVWKIGNSWAPSKRLSQLQVGNSQVLYLRYQVEGDFKLEKKIQKHLKKYHIAGEHFQLDNDFVFRLVQDLKNGKNISSSQKQLSSD